MTKTPKDKKELNDVVRNDNPFTITLIDDNNSKPITKLLEEWREFICREGPEEKQSLSKIDVDNLLNELAEKYTLAEGKSFSESVVPVTITFASIVDSKNDIGRGIKR